MRADRLVAIVLLLQVRGHVAAPALARELEVSTRTIYRDVEALSAAGVPVYAERGPQGGIRLLEGYRTDLTGMNAGEAEALLVMGIPGPIGRLGLGPQSEAARRKVLAALPSSERDAADAVRQKIHVDPDDWADVALLPHLVAVAEAVWSERRIRMEYVRADNERVTRRVDPLGVVLKAGTWYLVAMVGEWEVTFRVERIRSVEILDQPARRPAGFDLAERWQAVLQGLHAERTPVAVRLEVDATAAASLPRHLGEEVRDQLVAGLAAGTPHLVVEARFDSEDGAVAAVLAMGASVEVLEPAGLRRRIAAEAGRLLDRYATERPALD